jgi:hypothetical protein
MLADDAWINIGNSYCFVKNVKGRACTRRGHSIHFPVGPAGADPIAPALPSARGDLDKSSRAAAGKRRSSAELRYKSTF